MFTVTVAQKNHHTKLFQADSFDNEPSGLLFVDFYVLMIFLPLAALTVSLQGLLWTQKLGTLGIIISTMCAHAGMVVIFFFFALIRVISMCKKLFFFSLKESLSVECSRP